MSQFASNLNRIRKSRKLTQEELAKRIGVSRSTIGMYEQGNREPDFETLEAIADALNVNMEALVGYDAAVKNAPWEQEYEWRDELRSNPDLRMLLSASSKLNQDDIKYLIALAERMNRE